MWWSIKSVSALWTSWSDVCLQGFSDVWMYAEREHWRFLTIFVPTPDQVSFWLLCLMYPGYWEEEHSYSQRSWQRYQREVLHELGCRGDDNEDGEDEDGDKYDSDWSVL